MRLCGSVTIAFGLAIAMGQALAARHAHPHVAYHPPTAAIVVDADTGKVLFSENAASQRHPASLTKVMTLYLLFERLEDGRIRLDSPLTISEHAAAQQPTKLNLEPGSVLAVEDAIRAIVTKSANDAAVAVAEALGGSEEAFAAEMTRRARDLGMKKTNYVNASGLPDKRQISTAHDQAILGIAVSARFPQYYAYFSVRAFEYNGETMVNHNKLLGKVAGLDGIKTGYIRESGFNLLASLRRPAKHVVAVVLGSITATARDARMRQLLETYSGSPMVASASALRSEPVSMPDSRAAFENASLPSRVDAAADAGASPAQLFAQTESFIVSPGAPPASSAEGSLPPTSDSGAAGTTASSERQQARSETDERPDRTGLKGWVARSTTWIAAAVGAIFLTLTWALLRGARNSSVGRGRF